MEISAIGHYGAVRRHIEHKIQERIYEQRLYEKKKIEIQQHQRILQDRIRLARLNDHKLGQIVDIYC